MKKRIAALVCMLVLIFIVSCDKHGTRYARYVRVRDGRFEIGGEPYRFIGANFWYGALLASSGAYGDRPRLARELDLLSSLGVNNLRILIGADGSDGIPSKVVPALQIAPGVYNEEVFEGLDYLLAELERRRMYAVLYFTNSWEWSGGYGQYLEWAGKGEVPVLSIDGWETYQRYIEQYAVCRRCTELLKKHITHVITRCNTITGRPYSEEPAVMSWQIANEPRAFSEESKAAFEQWISEVAAHIRSLDANHLISIGSEGEVGTERDLELYRRMHADPNVDYLTVHIWPKNWGWLDTERIPESLETCIARTMDYLDRHLKVGRMLCKPVVVEEFGFPRDHHRYLRDDPTSARDGYYEALFSRVTEAAGTDDVLAGCNFWAWGGYAVATPGHTFWAEGDPYMGDPAQEEQGLNSVFAEDSTTLRTIAVYAREIQTIIKR